MKHFKVSLSAIVLVILSIVLVSKIFHTKRYQQPETVIAWDVISYYAYLPATFIEHDLTLSFTDHEHAGTYWPETLPDGTKVIKTSMGLSLLYLPFFAIAHLTAPLAGYEANGFTLPYALALLLAGLFYTLLGLALLRKLLLEHFGEIATTLTLLIIGLCTNLYWYSVYEAPMSHSFGFGLFCLFAYLTVKWHKKPGYLISIGLGLTLGLISLVRPTNCIVVLFFLLYGIKSLKGIKEKWQLFLGSYKKILIIAASTILVWVPQMIYWYSLTGHLFFYSYGSDERFFFNHPMILQGLFGFRKGWLIYTPAMVFALIGFIPLYKHFREYFWGILLFLALHIYIIFSWWCWWYGGGFGLRAMIETYALLSIPLTATLQWILKMPVVRKTVLLVCVAAVSFLSCFHNIQYFNGAIHWDSMTKESYFDSFLRMHPTSRFDSLLQTPDYEAARKGDR
ncbi:MAG: hypothetical protein J6T33_02005 [Bacteroidales bacterium]|nr:hypothetical protein [Bacteroidales bacterium]